MPENEDLGETSLHLAGTRPAMVPVIAIPWTALILLIGVTAMCAEFYWKFAFLAVPFWPLGFFIFRRDHNGLRIFAAWLRTAGLDMRAAWFGGTSVEVCPQGYSGHYRGIPDVG